MRDKRIIIKSILLIVAILISTFSLYYYFLRPEPPTPPDGGEIPPPPVIVDDDEMDDSWEMYYGLDLNNPDDANGDRDGDGLTNLEEYLLGTNPLLTDTDDDGLSDKEEVDLGTDPTVSDTDEDELSDGEEVLTYNTDPTNPDSDQDGLSDGIEVNLVGSDPNKADTDEDGLNDWEEVSLYKTDPLLNDTEGDELLDGDEVNTYGTNPKDADSDHDLLTDKEELQYGTDPTNADTDEDELDDGYEPDWNVDTDGDGLINALDVDSDNDLLYDGAEILVGANPLDNDTDNDTVIDGWDPAPVDSDADDDGLMDGYEATTCGYWYEAEELVLTEAAIGDDPEARNGRAVFSSGSGIIFNYSTTVSEGRYKLFVMARAEFLQTETRSIELSVVQNKTVLVEDDLHLLKGLYRWYSTPFFTVNETLLQIVAYTDFSWVFVDRVALVWMESITSELTDPLDQDSDGDGILDGRESVLNSYWYEAEDFAWDSAQIIDFVNASNSKHIKPLGDGRIANVTEPSLLYPNGTYAVFVRAMSATDNLSNIVEVNIRRGGVNLTTLPVQLLLVRQVAYDSVWIPFNLYEWHLVLSFTLAHEDTIDIELTAIENLDDIFVDKVLVMRLDYWTDTSGIEYKEDNVTINTIFNVPRGISDPMDIDTDGDGYRAAEGFLSDSTGWLTDGFELYDLGTNPFDIDTDRDGYPDDIDVNPLSNDTDGDGLLDAIELKSDYNGTPTSPTDPDSDDDGIRDGDEDLGLNGHLNEGETNPTNPDSDFDGIPDGIEIGFFSPDAFPSTPPIITDPLNSDTDGDGLIDGDEDSNCNGIYEPVLNETRADEADTDFDGLDDFNEIGNFTDPNDYDSDDDWVPDGLEIKTYHTNATLNDTDHDKLTDGIEIVLYKTNPNSPHSDSDSLTDWEEVRLYSTNPLDSDTDHDGLDDDEEIDTIGTDPRNRDTDRDGVNDGTEVSVGSNPLNAPPKAYFSLSKNIFREIEKEFDGSASSDSDGQIVSYEWQFGDGSTHDMGMKTNHTYIRIGNVTVTLTVTDDDGESGVMNVNITILNQLPHANAGLDQTVFTNETLWVFGGAGTYDPDGSIVSYSWNFQDNTTRTGVATNHTYYYNGTYYVTLTVTDNDGGTDTDTVVITVETPRPPDFAISSEDVTFSRIDDDVVLSFTIYNLGDLDTSSVNIEVYDEVRTWISVRSRSPGIRGGSSLDFTTTLPSEPIGSHPIRIMVDPDHEVEELDEDNNVVRILVPDADGDGLSDFGEEIFGCNATNPDSDGDGLYDGPLIDSDLMEQDWNLDTDGDGLINVLDMDSDEDGFIDGMDIDPLHDLLVKVKIKRIKIEDPIDWGLEYRTRTIRIPYVSCSWSGCRIKYKTCKIQYPVDVKNKEAEPYFGVKISDQWESSHWMHSEVPVAEDAEDTRFSDPPIFVANAADDERYVDIRIEAWDLDVDLVPDIVSPYVSHIDLLADDRLDIGSGDTTYCKVTLDLAQAAQYAPGEYNWWISTSGTSDGSWSEDVDHDAKVEFEVYIDYELSYPEQVVLARKFSPQLYFHEDEIWRPRDIRDFLDNAKLKDESGDTKDSNITIEELVNYQGADYYLDLHDDYHDKDSSNESRLKIYAHVFTAYKDQIVIQYWFFYIYNKGSINSHEGDWEMIELILPPKESATSSVLHMVPKKVGYSWHYNIRRSSWNSGDLSKEDTSHPIVYAEKGGHASQLNQIDFFSPPGYTFEKENMTKYSIEILCSQSWLRFKGKWGQKGWFEFTTGPPGPVFRSTHDYKLTYYGEIFNAYMWTDPIFWYNYISSLPPSL